MMQEVLVEGGESGCERLLYERWHGGRFRDVAIRR